MNAGKITGEGLMAIDNEMARQHDDALASYEGAADVAAQVAEILRSRRRVILLGMGGSHAVNRMVEVDYRALGARAVAMTLSEQLYSPMDLSDAAVIVTSQSGESAEVHRILATLGGHDAAFGITLEPASTLGRALPSLIGAGGTERAFAATRSLMITLALHLRVLSALGLDAEPSLEALRARVRLDITEAVKLLKNCKAVIYSGRALRGLAEAAALSTMELARMPAYALEGGQFRHGPLEALGPQLGAVHFCADEEATSLVAGLAGDTVAAGSPTLLFDTSGSDVIHADLILRFPKASGLAAIFTMLPSAQRLAIGIAGQRVSDVGIPLRTTKITRSE
ncbi:SIS domain-containing protein [Dongia deserti]|uniref:SIS domain-containing protein n=1 Tax=Dongia deserti TaxID=2268030 RepID=UPI000E657BF3|nr:aminotransferase [Dongia deserti]